MALDLEASSLQRIELPDVAALEVLGPITLCAWLKIESTGGLRGIIYKGVGSSQETWLRISGATLHIGSWAPGDALATYVLTGAEVTDWVHVAGVYDGAAWRLYVSGVEVANFVTAQGAQIASGAGWRIGSNVGGSRLFDGLIDDARLYDRGLSPAEIQTIYTTGGPDGIVDGLLFRLTFQEAAPGATVVTPVDIGPVGYTLTPINAPVYAQSFVRGARRTA